MHLSDITTLPGWSSSNVAFDIAELTAHFERMRGACRGIQHMPVTEPSPSVAGVLAVASELWQRACSRYVSLRWPNSLASMADRIAELLDGNSGAHQ